MSATVTYMNGAQLQAAVQAANQAVSGMSFAEAAAALGGAAQTQTGGAQITAFPIPYQQYGQVTTEAMYASQLWQYWQTAGAAAGTTALGAAASAAVSWAQGALIGTGEGLAATAGLLTLSVPTAVAMAAPLLGVGLGAALYETNPTLWNNIADGLVDFTTEATQTISALIDEAGHVLLDSAFVQKLKQIFQDNDVPIGSPSSNEGTASYGGNTIPFILSTTDIQNNTTYTASANQFIIQFNNTIELCGVDNQHFPSSNGDVNLNYKGYKDYNGVRHYFYSRGWGYTNRYSPVPAVSPTNQWDKLLDCWVLGGPELQPVEYPEGLNIWNNPMWHPGGDPLPGIQTYPVYDPSTGTTRPYYPATPYIGDSPGTSADPLTIPQSNPTSPIPEWSPIEPYIPPVVNPEIQLPDTEEFSQLDPKELENPGAKDDPVILPIPDLNPFVDPVTIPDVEPAEELPTNKKPPVNTGESPPFIFPIPDLPFPSIVPAGSDTPLEPGVSGNAGFIQVYNPSASEFIAFGRWLWVTYAEATLETIWNNPFDGVIGAHELYATPSKDGYSTIRSGFLDSGIGSIIVRQRYTQINCGSIIIPEYYGNYLDYSPYARAYIYLPFIGIVDVDVDDIVGHAVNVLYHIDSYTGSCIAQITCARTGYSNTLYQFSGNCSVEIPMAGGSQATIKAAMMSANAYQNAANVAAGMSLVGGIGGGILSGLGSALGGNIAGGIFGGLGQALGGVTNAVTQQAYGEAQHTAAMVSQKSHVQHSGSFGSSYGAMGIKKPYIILRRPVQKVVYNYNELYGFPAHKQVVIGSCTGYLRCREVHVVSSLATDKEKEMIEQALKSGVYVTE